MRRISLAVAVAVFVLLLFDPLRSQAGTALDVKLIKAALRTADVEEDGFIERVSKLVVRDVLPRDMVETTFLWARKKPNHKFQFFKRGLTIRAAKIGVKL
jgi:hypothetical protein